MIQVLIFKGRAYILSWAYSLTMSNRNHFFLIYFLIGGKLLYSVVLVSAIPQGESVTNYIYIYLLPPSTAVSTSAWMNLEPVMQSEVRKRKANIY